VGERRAEGGQEEEREGEGGAEERLRDGKQPVGRALLIVLRFGAYGVVFVFVWGAMMGLCYHWDDSTRALWKLPFEPGMS